LYSEIEIGERKDKAALPYDEIKPVQLPNLPVAANAQTFKSTMASASFWAGSFDIAQLKAASQQRIASSKSFEIIKENAKRLKKLEEENIVFLNEGKFKKQQWFGIMVCQVGCPLNK
jgi:hypothetical protein